jgi:hypothetical protein
VGHRLQLNSDVQLNRSRLRSAIDNPADQQIRPGQNRRTPHIASPVHERRVLILPDDLLRWAAAAAVEE